MSDQYDIVILGGGSGGYVAAIRAAQLGFKTAVIERHKLGGTCLHYGCIPTKAFLESAHVYTEFQEREYWGLIADNVGYDYAKIMKFKDGIVDKNWKGVQFLMKKNKIDVIEGDGLAESRPRPSQGQRRSPNGGGQESDRRHGVAAPDLRAADRRKEGLHQRPRGESRRHADLVDHSGRRGHIGRVRLLLPGVRRRRYGGRVLPTLIPLMDADLGIEMARLFSSAGSTC